MIYHSLVFINIAIHLVLTTNNVIHHPHSLRTVVSSTVLVVFCDCVMCNIPIKNFKYDNDTLYRTFAVSTADNVLASTHMIGAYYLYIPWPYSYF